MKTITLTTTKIVSDILSQLIVYLVAGIVVLALSTQSYFLYLKFTDNENKINSLVDGFNQKFNGAYKNTPGNIFYVEDTMIWVESVTNQVKIGKLAGNRNLEFGVKNILEEYLQEMGYGISDTAPYKLKVDIIYLDVLTTKSNLSVFHKSEEEVVIRMKGTLYKDGKKIKEVVAEESSAEISMSTLIVDQGGKFNQTSLSNALKKSSEKLITKLFEKK